MLTVGLTGGIATGKSAVSEILRSKPTVLLVDADTVAREACAVGSDGLAAVVDRFGHGFLQDDGTLDRRLLGELVVNDGSARSDLEAILHPRIAASISQRNREARQAGVELFVVEAALMIETGSYVDYDVLVVVTCRSETQLKRLMERDGVTAETARKWVSTQLPLAEKTRLADHILFNNGDLRALELAVDALVAKLLPQ